MRFLDFIEQQQGEGTTFDRIGQLSALFKPHIPRGSANQTLIRMFMIELGHIESNARLFISKQELGKGSGKLCLSDTRWSNEEQSAFWRPLLAGVLQSG